MTTHTLLLFISLLFDLALVVAVMARRQGRVAGRFPFFTALIGFEAFRCLFGLTLSGHLGAPLEQLAGTIFGSLRLALAIAVAWELYFAVARLRRPKKRRSVQRELLFGGILTVSAVAALGLPWLLAQGLRPAIDRGALFTAILMLGVFASCHNRLHRSESGRMMQGFAVLSVATIVSQIGATTEAAGSGSSEPGTWLSVVPAMTILVLAFWLYRFAVPVKQVSGPILEGNQVLAA